MKKRPYATVKRSNHSKESRQACKAAPVISDEAKPTRRQRAAMIEMTLWLKGRRKGGYRWLARHTNRGPQSFGWWQRLATGRQDVKPTAADFRALKQLYGLMQDEADLDEQALALLLEIVEHRGLMDAALSRLLALVRRRETER